jgi:putative aldouronate transport system substrate-binding protein
VVSAAHLPSYVPFKGPKPDLPGSPGIDPGYLTYPKDLVRSVTSTPGKGGTVTALVPIYTDPPTPMGQNALWQAVNQGAGVTLAVNASGAADYAAKLSTVVAGGDLPDFIQLPGSVPFPHLPDFLKASCVDLTPYLAGNAVKEYPNLANIPTYAWKTCVVGGALYGLPVTRANLSSSMLFVQQQLLDQVGISRPRNLDEFTRLVKELTRPQQGRWGIVSHMQAGSFGLNFFLQVFKGPNNWRLDSSGKLTKDIESQEARAAVSYIKQLYDAGVFYPDSATIATNAAKLIFGSSRAATVFDSWSAYQGYWDKAAVANPDIKVRGLKPFAHDGSRAPYFLGSGSFGTAVLKKASSSRVRELLGIANYLAAPFGTEEALLRGSGVRDVDYKLDANGNPLPTPKGLQDANVPWGYIVDIPKYLYDVRFPGYVPIAHQQEVEFVPLGVGDPTIGYYSPTWADKGATLNRLVTDRLNDIITGRAPMSTFDTMLSAWRSGGGDAARKEYQQALSSSK